MFNSVKTYKIIVRTDFENERKVIILRLIIGSKKTRAIKTGSNHRGQTQKFRRENIILAITNIMTLPSSNRKEVSSLEP